AEARKRRANVAVVSRQSQIEHQPSVGERRVRDAPLAGSRSGGNLSPGWSRGLRLSESSVKTLFLTCLLLIAAGGPSDRQVVRLDSVSLMRGARSGTWSATNGKSTFMGTWTSVPDNTSGAVTGTWTLANAEGKTVAFGGWSAVKANDHWSGAWRANVTGQGGEYSGTWASSVGLKPSSGLVTMFEKAAGEIVSGTWSMAARGQSGAWSIRPAK